MPQQREAVLVLAPATRHLSKEEKKNLPPLGALLVASTSAGACDLQMSNVLLEGKEFSRAVGRVSPVDVTVKPTAAGKHQLPVLAISTRPSAEQGLASERRKHAGNGRHHPEAHLCDECVHFLIPKVPLPGTSWHPLCRPDPPVCPGAGARASSGDTPLQTTPPHPRPVQGVRAADLFMCYRSGLVFAFVFVLPEINSEHHQSEEGLFRTFEDRRGSHPSHMASLTLAGPCLPAERQACLLPDRTPESHPTSQLRFTLQRERR